MHRALESPSLELRMQADCLMAINNRSDESSQADIARKYNLTRAAISKRLRDMRRGQFLANLRNFFFGGKPDASQAAKVRALRVHKEQQPHKTKCNQKPSPFELARQMKTA
jgi:hypothetical protein